MEQSSFLSRAAGTVVNPLSKAVGSMREVLEHHTGESDEQQLLENMLQLFVLVLQADGAISAMEQQAVATLVRDTYGEAAANKLQQMIGAESKPKLDEVCAGLVSLTEEEKETLLRALFVAAFADNAFAKDEERILRDVARGLGLSDEVFDREAKEALEQHNRRMKLVRSSTGLIASVVVIGIFILAATFLKSVLFGLILAYFFLPLQTRYTDSFLNNGLAARLFGLANLVFVKPFAWVIRTVRGAFRRNPESEPPPESEEQRTQAAISKACNATVLTVAVTLLVLGLGLVVLAFTVSPKEIKTEDAMAQLAGMVGKAENFPVVGDEAKRLSEKLKDPKFLPQLKEQLMARASTDDEAKKSLMGGITKALGAVVGVLGALGNLMLNSLIYLFFFSFFLGKLAAFHHRHGGDVKEGDYLVQSLFETSWLPTTSEETLKSAADVVNEVFYKLKTWVRGYLWIIIIETAIYITAFLLLGIPYAIPLGMVAGMTVLLPFLGPLISLVLTIGVCLVSGHADVTLCLTLAGVYFVMNSIIEQLFLYPAFVGEALGLNILETLIVVLLGGLFAGLAGMIFAVPVASVLKFLVPRLYQSMRAGNELTLPGEEESEPKPA